MHSVSSKSVANPTTSFQTQLPYMTLNLPEQLTLGSIRDTAQRIRFYTVKTPHFSCELEETRLQLKFEFLQHAGSFKARGAMNNLLLLSDAERERGVTAVSAGNHAIATAYAARELGTSAKVFMHRKANPFRIQRVREFGGEVVLVDDIAEAFEAMRRLSETEGRAIIHPFEGFRTMQGTGTLGLEIVEQFEDFDTLLVAVGGGGLISGVGAAVKQLRPQVRVIGVEPEGAQGLTQSLELGHPLEKVEVNTIADSMGAPLHAPQSFSVCQQVIDRMVCVSDDAICAAMAWAADEFKLALEPAGCAVLAALRGPLQQDCAGKSVAAILCGSNIDTEDWAALVARGRKATD